VARVNPGFPLDPTAAVAVAAGVGVAAGVVGAGVDMPRCNDKTGGAVDMESRGKAASDWAVTVEAELDVEVAGGVTTTKSAPGEWKASSSLMGGGGGSDEVDKAMNGDRSTSRESW
jgi:hypothetical protein